MDMGNCVQHDRPPRACMVVGKARQKATASKLQSSGAALTLRVRRAEEEEKTFFQNDQPQHTRPRKRNHKGAVGHSRAGRRRGRAPPFPPSSSPEDSRTTHSSSTSDDNQSGRAARPRRKNKCMRSVRPYKYRARRTSKLARADPIRLLANPVKVSVTPSCMRLRNARTLAR